MSISLDTLNRDILICIFTTLSIPEILLLRQASRRLYLASQEHVVWRTVCTREILPNGIPFPRRPFTSFFAKDLERQALRAYQLSLNWRSTSTKLHRVVSSQVKCGAMEAIKFLSRHGRTWIVTTCVSIWWTLSVRDCDTLQEVANWSPAKALFNGIAVNTDDESDAAIAISVQKAGCMSVEILAIFENEAGVVRIQPQKTLVTPRKPIALNGDVVALCDHDSETLLLNWKTQEQALLKNPNTWQDKPLHVVFVHGSVFVVRARSICIFEQPQMALPGEDLEIVLPRVVTSFGWVDGVSLALKSSASLCFASSIQPSLTLLVRNKGRDPWRPIEQFQFMTLNADFDHEHGSAPFSLASTLSSQHRGPIRCSDMVVGSYGTAVWVQPTEWAVGGLITDDSFIEAMATEMTPGVSRETLVVALFPGLLNQGSPEAHVKVVLENVGNDWSCLDYDEARGLIALGSSFGEVIVYRL